jgi:hypothetical protein
VSVCLPAALHERLVQVAAKEYRLLTSEMLALIQETLDKRKRRQKQTCETRELPDHLSHYLEARHPPADAGL